jgi:hypothetical protein
VTRCLLLIGIVCVYVCVWHTLLLHQAAPTGDARAPSGDVDSGAWVSMARRDGAFDALRAWIRGVWLNLQPCSPQLRHLRSVVPVSLSRVEEFERCVGAVLPSDL